MTSIRRSSTLDRFWMLRSASRVLVVTLAPPSLQMRAAALSRGPPLDRKTPDWAHAARWSPRGSRGRRHRQERAESGRCKRRRRRRRIRKRWEGYSNLLSTLNAGNLEADMDFRSQATSGAFYANKLILCDENVSLNSRIKFFDSVVTSVVRFEAGQRKLYKFELGKLDVHCRNHWRQVVGHQEALTGLNRGTPSCTTGTNVMGCPSDEILQVAEHWGVAGCSPRQSSLTAVPTGSYHFYTYVIYLLGFIPAPSTGCHTNWKSKA